MPVNYFTPDHSGINAEANALNLNADKYSGNAPQSYNKGGDTSSVGQQIVDYMFFRKALIDEVETSYVSQFVAGTYNIPKYHGKSMVLYHYYPIIDARNDNDQGIDATGNVVKNTVAIVIIDVNTNTKHIDGFGSDEVTALADAQARVVSWARHYFGEAIGNNYATIVATMNANGWSVVEGQAKPGGGNFWGGTKDLLTAVSKLPTLGEFGGRRNRIGVKRTKLQGVVNHFGFFYEYTEDSFLYDTQGDTLRMHIAREVARAAKQIQELQIYNDLVNGAGVVMYGGTTALMEAELDHTSELDYNLLLKLHNILTANKCPTKNTMVTGSRNVDTRTIAGGRFMLIPTAVVMTLHKMKDAHGDPAFVRIEQYGAARTPVKGEVGAVGHFRFIEVPEMKYGEGTGADVTAEGSNFEQKDGKYNVYPCLVIGDESFYSITLADRKASSMQIISKTPGRETADRSDPFGKIGFYSAQWNYGSIIVRPERIAVVKVTAPMTL